MDAREQLIDWDWIFAHLDDIADAARSSTSS